ncbi:ABC transporter permease [Clostridium sp. AM58-1XD]|uniref:ABC transporter permease n=1 Tax=Clostridium sp. AM58-1XD TaxID=2292307 RepID=UPI000E4E64E1|nr:ABC transporter permease [Clostridium sp. AM58-1XD]RGY97713.1 ABC transporter permease [Clostridium sp. AM58-1XD]
MKDFSLKKLTSQRLFLPIFCLILVLLVNVVTTPGFFAISVRDGVLYGYIIDIVNRASELVILAIGMTLVVSSSAGTDISVGAIMAVSAAVCCNLLSGGERAATAYANPLILGFLAALAVGVVIGCFNGLLVSKLNIQPMVATLIMFTAGRGIAQLVTDGQITYVRVESYKILGSFLPGVPVPTPFIVAAVMVALTALLLKKTALGMYIQSVGINKKASRLVGIKATLIIFLTYAFCGLCSGLAGMIASSRIYSADANNIGLNMELDAILAVAIGGNSLGGGKFSLAGSVIGAYTIQALTTTLYAMHVSSDQVPVYKAIVVVIIVTLQSPGFAKWRKALAQKKELKLAAGKEAA